MPATRKAIMDALCARVFAVTDFKTTGRRKLLWSKVPLDKQPACFVDRGNETTEHPNTMLAERIMRADIVIYVQVGSNPEAEPGTAIDDLLEALDQAFLPDSDLTNELTLGGLVQHCRIQGDTDIDQGGLDGQAKAVVPVEILLP
jgi:hypothetical protein